MLPVSSWLWIQPSDEQTTINHMIYTANYLSLIIVFKYPFPLVGLLFFCFNLHHLLHYLKSLDCLVWLPTLSLHLLAVLFPAVHMGNCGTLSINMDNCGISSWFVLFKIAFAILSCHHPHAHCNMKYVCCMTSCFLTCIATFSSFSSAVCIFLNSSQVACFSSYYLQCLHWFILWFLFLYFICFFMVGSVDIHGHATMYLINLI